ncbi:MAG: flagellar hook protein FlgE [Sulfurisoma sp.]|nr:flagellar hook protein FlgE [Sulfurisoma sp.]
MGFQQGLSGLNASSKALDTLGNNIANSGTVGFKSSSTQFSDVFAASLGGGSQVGIGISVTSIAQQFGQGNVTATSNPLDLAINGQGFFRLNDNGTNTWTRNGQFNVDKSGYIVSNTGSRLTGYLANTASVIVPSTPADIFVNTADLQPQATGNTGATGGVRMGFNLDSRATTFGVAPPFSFTDPTTYTTSTSVSVYDTLGNPHLMSLFFRKGDGTAGLPANTWQLYTSIDGGVTIGTDAAGPTPVIFSGTGALTTPASGIVAQSLAVTTGATSPLIYNLDLSGSTQFGNIFGVNSISQDGYTSGRLAGLSVSSDGTIQGRYSNGQTRDLAQVVLGNFSNPNGLSSLGNNQWAETADSGQPLVGVPGSGSLGVLQSAAIEESNVDLTAELVAMITQQRAYQANAQTIKTQDQILQTLVNLR